MGFEMREAWRRLCDEIGWSYAVFWKAIGFPSPKHLVWDDGHWLGKLQFSRSNDVNSHFSYLAEFQSLGEGSIDELGYQVHGTTGPCYIGVGIVGQAASTGNHCWILRNDSESTLKKFHDVNNQFLAGIQTIVIVPVFSHGIVQFGSIKRVMENLLFVNHVRTLFTQLATSENTFGYNSNIFKDNCNNVYKSLSIRCNHQLSISSGTSSISTQVTEKKSEFDAEGLQNKKNVGVASSPFSDLSLPSIHQVGNSLSHL